MPYSMRALAEGYHACLRIQVKPTAMPSLFVMIKQNILSPHCFVFDYVK